MVVGSRCEGKLFCPSQPCKNTAVCEETGDGYTCRCTNDFTGVNCETKIIRPCDTTPCQNNGVCTNVADSDFQCACSTEFTGSRCETAIHPCVVNRCLHGGTCKELGVGQYSCTCMTNYVGVNCEVPAPCGSNPCHDDATCLNSGKHIELKANRVDFIESVSFLCWRN